ncbi:helix-turn-helix domain-containing protein [Xylophilus rhododendri]|uniref:Helix-turn-helix domain-containing protein n=1 Tax=Xylophilus rhododendri TaxID=2697032 RepID=A0A857J255_9BURK|nr:helix-turn-helix domain-containing protein [Xylophilus rhododendri]QHI97219.1 helix-turn-helix domain-containing protein [Xylophilus rhododendri]
MSEEAQDGFAEEAGEKKEYLYVAAVERAMRVLEAFATRPGDLGLTELADMTGLGKSAAQRFVFTWEKLGYLSRDGGSRRLRLTSKAVELGHSYLKGDPLIAQVAPHLAVLRDQFGLAVNLSLRRGDDMVYLLRLPSRQLTLAEMLPGRRLPAWSNASGRMLLTGCREDELREMYRRQPPIAFTPRTTTDLPTLLAEIAQAREDGYVITQHQVNMHQIAVAILATVSSGAQVAIGMATTLDDYSPARVQAELIPALFRAAAALR